MKTLIYIILLTLAICLTGCVTAYKLEEQPDGTFKRIPLATVNSFLADLNYESKHETVSNGVKTVDYLKIEMKGRGTSYLDSAARIAQGAFESAAP